MLPRIRFAGCALLLIVCFCSTVMTAQQPANGLFSESEVESAMSRVQDGLVANDADLILSAFDRNQMRDYATFSGGLRSLLNRYESFRVHYQITQWAVTKCGNQQCGIATVDFQFEADPVQQGQPALYRSEQVHLTLLPEKKVWKIVQFEPRELLQ